MLSKIIEELLRKQKNADIITASLHVSLGRNNLQTNTNFKNL